MDGQFEAEEQRINLGSIKRIDSTITAIIDKSAHVAFYKFDGSSWHKTNVEGSLFVFSRCQSPYYGFVIQNRRNMENVCEALIDGVEFQRASQFLLYKTQNSIHSIWFSEESECIKIARILQQLMQTRTELPLQERRQQAEPRRKEQNTSREMRNKREKAQSKPGKQSPKQSNDILDLFHQAHKRYSCSESESGSHGNYKDGSHGYKDGSHGYKDGSHGYKDGSHGYKDGSHGYKESDQETSKVTILKRDVKQKRGDREREEELVSLVKRGEGERSSPEDEPVRLSAGYEREGKKAITFQELMNSAKPKTSPTSSSSPDIDKLSLSDGNHGYKDSQYNATVSTSQYSTAVQDLASSAQLLMSPMDFQKSPPPPTLPKASPVKRTLFPTPAPPPVAVHSQYDLDQFKKMLITAIQTDKELVRQMYNAMLAQDQR